MPLGILAIRFDLRVSNDLFVPQRVLRHKYKAFYTDLIRILLGHEERITTE
jgi:hypothetical protein